MADNNGGAGQFEELDRVNATIEAYEQQVGVLNEALAAIEAQNNDDNVPKQILEYQLACERDPANIPAEDAFDTITRLQNTLKVVKRRNRLLARENTTQQKLLQDHSNELIKLTKEHEKLVDITGWHKNMHINYELREHQSWDLNQMKQLEVTVRKELQSAQSIIKKKEKIILELEEQNGMGEEMDAQINNVFNDIRVTQRDCRDLEIRLERMRKEDKSNDEALTVHESQRSCASLEYVKSDMDFLKEALAEMKIVCHRQDDVARAQIARQQQLIARLDTIMQSLRELKMDKAYERNVSKSALVPSSSREEPDDVSKILPDDETIPVHTYRLIYKNNQMLHTSLARKNMLALEKEGVVAALEANIAKYAEALNMTSRQQEELLHNKDMEMGELMEELQQQQQNYFRQLEQVMQENNEIKKKLHQSTPSRPIRSL